jgi:Pyruvate/2-oxoacid:ferredoxin oxidoreductase delta subunit
MGILDDNVAQNYLALVALLVSLVALMTTVLQVLQQYFSSAEGYRRCKHCSIFCPSPYTRAPDKHFLIFSLIVEGTDC